MADGSARDWPAFTGRKTDIARHGRQILLKEIGGPGQARLGRARVLVVGIGGLGCPLAQYLAAAGIGCLRLVDHDQVELSNLNRQILFTPADLGQPKVDAAARALVRFDPDLTVEPIQLRFTDQTARALLDGVDCVIDGTDDFATRFAVNAACRVARIPLVSGAIGRWQGQVATFDFRQDAGPCYRCFVPQVPADAETCAQIGIVGAVAGLTASYMALEAVHLLAGTGPVLAGKILLIDAQTMATRTLTLPPDPACPVCGAPSAPLQSGG